MPSEPRWLDPEGVVRLNERLVGATGEPHRLISLALLESACARPQNHWVYDGEEDIPTLAAELLFAIVRNHPFLQGNKRTGFSAMIGFLQANGYQFAAADNEAWADLILAVLAGQATQESFVQELRGAIEPTVD